MALKNDAEALAGVLGVPATKGQISLEDLSLEELLDVRRGNQEYSVYLRNERMTLDKELGDIDSIIALRLEQTGSRVFEHAGFRGGYVKLKIGSASMITPAIARAKLKALAEVPARIIDGAFEEATVVKGKLREFRKIAEYSSAAAALVKSFISEPIEHEVLEIEELRPQIDVTKSLRALHSVEL